MESGLVTVWAEVRINKIATLGTLADEHTKPEQELRSFESRDEVRPVIPSQRPDRWHDVLPHPTTQVALDLLGQLLMGGLPKKADSRSSGVGVGLARDAAHEIGVGEI